MSSKFSFAPQGTPHRLKKNMNGTRVTPSAFWRKNVQDLKAEADQFWRLLDEYLKQAKNSTQASWKKTTMACHEKPEETCSSERSWICIEMWIRSECLDVRAWCRSIPPKRKSGRRISWSATVSCNAPGVWKVVMARLGMLRGNRIINWFYWAFHFASNPQAQLNFGKDIKMSLYRPLSWSYWKIPHGNFASPRSDDPEV